MSNIIEAIKAFVILITKYLTKGVDYIDLVIVRLEWAKIWIPQVVNFITVLVKDQDHKLAGLPPSLTEDELKAKKEIAFRTVGNETEAYFANSPSVVPRGVIDSLIKEIVYYEHNKDGDERSDKAKSLGILISLDEEDQKKIVENGLNKGWTGF